MQMYVQDEQQGQHWDLHDQPNVSSLNLAVEQHASVLVIPYSMHKTHRMCDVQHMSSDTFVTCDYHWFLLFSYSKLF